MHRPATNLLVLLLAMATPATADHLAITVDVDPGAGSIAARATVTLAPDAGAQQVTLLLNRALVVDALTADVPLTGFRHGRERPGPYRYAPQATPLIVDLATPATGQPVQIRLRYHGAIEPDDWNVIQVTDAWVELANLYSGWAPFHPDRGPFGLDLHVHLPADWRAVGTGRLERVGQRWTANAADVADVVLLAAPDLRQLTVGPSLTISFADLPAGVPGRIADDTRRVRAMLDGWFGPATGDHVDLVFAPRPGGGGYARPGLVVMLHDPRFHDGPQTSPDFVRYLAHEVSHLWWRQAPATSWQDWLNESFAEFSALRVLREWAGEQTYRERLAAYREAAAGTPPIRGLDRSDDAAFAVLYRKGPVILADLADAADEAAFDAFLREMAARRVSDTATCLAVLAETVSSAARDSLAAALQR